MSEDIVKLLKAETIGIPFDRAQVLRDAAAELTRLRARVTELEAGLRPFANQEWTPELVSRARSLLAGEAPGPSTLAATSPEEMPSDVRTRAFASGRGQPAPESE